MYNKNIYVYKLPQCHAGTRAGLRGSATWPWVSRRIHVGPHDKCTLFAHFWNVLNQLKIENKLN